MYLIKYDRDGGESDPVPYDTLEEAFNAGENCYDNPQWVSYNYSKNATMLFFMR